MKRKLPALRGCRFELPAAGIAVFEAESDERARQIMEHDPAVKAGLFKARVSPFSLAFLRP